MNNASIIHAHGQAGRHFGLTAFAGGTMLVIFGFKTDIILLGLSVGLILVTFAAAIFSFAKHESVGARICAFVGVTIALLMVALHFLFGIDGFVGTLLKPYEQL